MMFLNLFFQESPGDVLPDGAYEWAGFIIALVTIIGFFVRTLILSYRMGQIKQKQEDEFKALEAKHDSDIQDIYRYVDSKATDHGKRIGEVENSCISNTKEIQSLVGTSYIVDTNTREIGEANGRIDTLEHLMRQHITEVSRKELAMESRVTALETTLRITK